MMRRPPSDLLDLLRGCGLPWRFENGNRHYKVMIGERFVGILPRSGGRLWEHGRQHKNLIAQVRRAIAAGGGKSR